MSVAYFPFVPRLALPVEQLFSSIFVKYLVGLPPSGDVPARSRAMDACGGDAGSDGGARAPFEATFALVLSMTSRSSSLATGAPVPRAPVDMVRALDADERAFVFAASSLVAGGIARRGVTRLGRRAERLKPRRAGASGDEICASRCLCLRTRTSYFTATTPSRVNQSKANSATTGKWSLGWSALGRPSPSARLAGCSCTLTTRTPSLTKM